eukprot:TRINITY_DN16709_c0_g1_i1.p1 TRINITY_DN16709_c0_g1~~TRINITY_DN16709_c0_g1_i1.p1  ORF type:complete len:639 (+),score=78.24 TRINITY_DN16709_c0_g1_i1:101-2017(+)
MADGVASATMAMVMGMSAPRPPAPSPPVQVTKLRRTNSSNNTVITTEGVCMCIPYKIQYCWGVNSHDRSESKVNQEIKRVLELARTTFQPDQYNNTSLVARINKQALDDPISITCDMETVLSATTLVNNVTDGLFNPAAEAGSSPSALWPSLFEISRSKEGSILLVKKKPFKMNLSGISKGWVIDQLHNALCDLGITQSYVDWGGDIRCQGGHPSGRPWIVNIRSLEGDKNVKSLELTTASVATSGDYGSLSKELQKSLSIDDLTKMIMSAHVPHLVDDSKHDVHETELVDPLTGDVIPYKKSSSSPYSVTVGCSSCMFADALATTCMVLNDPAKVKKFIKTVDLGLKDDISHFIVLTRSDVNMIMTPAPVCNQSVRGVTRYLAHQVYILHTTDIAVTNESVVAEWDVGQVFFALEKNSRLTSHIRQNQNCTLQLSQLSGDSASVTLAMKHSSNTNTDSISKALPSNEIRVTDIKECGDRVIVQCQTVGENRILPECKLITGTDTKGRWYKSALSQEKNITTLATASFVGEDGKSLKAPVRHLGSTSITPPFVHFVLQDPSLTLKTLQPVQIVVSSPESGISNQLKQHGIIQAKVRQISSFDTHTHFIVASVTKIEPATRFDPLIVDMSGTVVKLLPI